MGNDGGDRHGTVADGHGVDGYKVMGMGQWDKG